MLNFKVYRENFEGQREVVICSDRNEVLAWTGNVINGEEERKYIKVECKGDARRAAAMGDYKVLAVKMIPDKEYWNLLWRGYKEVQPVNFIDLGEETQVQRRKEIKSEDEDTVILDFDLSCFNC